MKRSLVRLLLLHKSTQSSGWIFPSRFRSPTAATRLVDTNPVASKLSHSITSLQIPLEMS